MKDYPLGSFPRFGYQEKRAQERRQRAIANSIATRRYKKWRRENQHLVAAQEEAFRVHCEQLKREQHCRLELIRVWNTLIVQIRGKSPPTDDLCDEAVLITYALRRISKRWNRFQSNADLLRDLFNRIQCFIEKWNHAAKEEPKNPKEKEKKTWRAYLSRFLKRLKYHLIVTKI